MPKVLNLNTDSEVRRRLHREPVETRQSEQ